MLEEKIRPGLAVGRKKQVQDELMFFSLIIFSQLRIMMNISMKKQDENVADSVTNPQLSSPKVVIQQAKAYTNFSIRIKNFQHCQSKNNENQVEKFTVKIKPLEVAFGPFRQFKVKVSTFVDETTNTTEAYNEETTEDQVSALTFCQFRLKDEIERASEGSFSELTQFMKLRFRNQEKNMKINLKVCDLKEIVEFCFKKQIVSKEIYKKFYLNYNSIQEKNFISLEKKEIGFMDFKKPLFSLLDHRFFCKVLTSNYPDEFQFQGKPIAFDLSVTQYLTYIYSLTTTQYENYYEDFNKTYHRFWMPDKNTPMIDVKLQKMEGLSTEDENEYIQRKGRKKRKKNF